MTPSRALIVLLTLLLAWWQRAGWSDHLSIHIGVLSYRLPKAEAAARWQVLANYLQERIPHVRVHIEPYGYGEFEQALAQRRMDFVLTTPALYITGRHRLDLSAPLLSLVEIENGKPVMAFGGTIFTRQERTDIAHLSDLKGKIVAISTQNAFAGFLIQAYELLRVGIKAEHDLELREVGMPQERVVEAVLRGDADVGFVRSGLLESMARNGKLDLKQVRVINPQQLADYPYAVSSLLYPGWVFAAVGLHRSELAREVTVALLSLPPGGEIAQRIGIYGFTIPADYTFVETVLRRLRHPPFDYTPEFTAADVWRRYHLTLLGLCGAALLTLGFLVGLFVIQRRLTQEHAYLQAIVTGTGAGTWEWWLSKDSLTVSPRFAEILGYQPNELNGLTGHAWFDWLHPDDHATWQRTLSEPLAGQSIQLACECRLRHRDGHWLWGLLSGQVDKRGRDLRPLRLVGTFTDISERKRLEAELLQRATTDPLTGLANRRRFFEQLQSELARLQRQPEQSAALLILDLDHFKDINDTYGHTAGDAVLVHFSLLLQRDLRTTDLAARMGGEEFAVLLAGATLSAAVRRAERLRSLVQKTPAPHAEGYIAFTVSIGVAALDRPELGSEYAIKQADTALYRAKRQGRNRIEVAVEHRLVD